MEYLVFVLALGAFVLFIFVSEAARAGRRKKEFVRYLYEDFGRTIEKEYPLERYARMGSFFRKHPAEGQIDDITWNDLGMDDLFKRMNYTLSASGEEYLYYVLRTPKRDAGELEHLESVVQFFGTHPDERVQVQLAVDSLGYTGKYSLYDYLDNLGFLGERSNRKHILMDLLYLPLVGFLWVNFSVGILGIVTLTIYNILTYFREKGEIDPYITSFSYLMRLMRTCGELEKVSVPPCGGEWERLRKAGKSLQGMRTNSYWVMSPQRGNASGDILAVFMDYVRMIFHVDLIKFNRMLRVLREHIGDVDSMISVVGYVETAIAIWALRRSLEAGAAEKVPGTQRGVPGEAGAVSGARSDEADRVPGAQCRVPGEAGAVSGARSDEADRVSGAWRGEPGGAGAVVLGARLDTTERVPGTRPRGGWCIPEFCREGERRAPVLEMKEGYHLLLTAPVKNSISTRRGVLLTGSNASGKSTFLKTVAINAILAQTIHTCAADAYRTDFFRVYSSMALRDDIGSGESYYIVEIKALKRILDAASEGGGPVLCFVDEVLRGTNTVERIAASTQILKSLSGSGILCFAATHDMELTELLKREFENYHFEEDVRDGDVFFNYKLQSGRAVTRNAIKLLELMGYDQSIIDKAHAQAERFAQTGVWE